MFFFIKTKENLRFFVCGRYPAPLSGIVMSVFFMILMFLKNVDVGLLVLTTGLH